MAKFIALSSGQLIEVQPVASSAGAGDAGKMIQLDSNGRIDNSMMPVGIGADTASIVSSENLSAGDFVNLWNDAGTLKVRKADAGNAQPADGFVLAAVTAPASATVYFEGQNNQVSGLTVGDVLYLSAGTAGAVTATAPSGSGDIVQELGKAIATTAMSTEIGHAITLV